MTQIDKNISPVSQKYNLSETSKNKNEDGGGTLNSSQLHS